MHGLCSTTLFFIHFTKTFNFQYSIISFLFCIQYHAYSQYKPNSDQLFQIVLVFVYNIPKQLLLGSTPQVTILSLLQPALSQMLQPSGPTHQRSLTIALAYKSHDLFPRKKSQELSGNQTHNLISLVRCSTNRAIKPHWEQGGRKGWYTQVLVLDAHYSKQASLMEYP